MVNLGRQFVEVIYMTLIVFILVFSTFNLELNASNVNQNELLINRISKDFSKKFCNGVGFGLSQESALNFAMKENMAIFSKKKGIENIDNKILIEKISSSIIDNCGYPLNISEDQLESNFQNSN